MDTGVCHSTVACANRLTSHFHSQCSSIEGGTRDEWVSEGVQVGGVASAMGVLGLWTGASHQRMDPLGMLLKRYHLLLVCVLTTVPIRSLLGVEGGVDRSRAMLVSRTTPCCSSLYV